MARLIETYFLKAEASIVLDKIDRARSLVQIVIDRQGNKVNPSGEDINNALDGVTDKTVSLEAYLIESGKELMSEYNGRWQLRYL